MACRYFQMAFVHPELPYLQPDKHYLVVQFPHATYPMAPWLTYSFVGTPGSGKCLALLCRLVLGTAVTC